jgi:N-methylhydantoinase B
LETVLTKYFPPDQFQPGDIILTNDPYAGGESKGSHHTNDMVAIEPIFWSEKLIGFATVMVHHRDVGGMWPNNNAWNEEIWQEGLRLEPVKLYTAGQLVEPVLKLILNNTRAAYHMRGDLMAQISACHTGVNSMIRLATKYGLELLLSAAEELMNYSDRRTRAELSYIPNGRYEHEEVILEDGTAGGPYRLKVAIEVKDGELFIDFEGTDRQIKGPTNAPWSATYSATLYTIRCLTDPTIPSNDGCQRAVTIKAQRGSLVNCQMPAATFQRMVVCHSLVDLIMGALAPAIPERVIADSCGCIYNDATGINLRTHQQGGDTDHRQKWSDGPSQGGLGARHHLDGVSAMACHVTNVANPPVEVTEIEAPVLILERALRPDSGGPGKQRGGLGQIYTWKALAEQVYFSWTSQKAVVPPQGMFGGLPGAHGRWRVLHEKDGQEQTLPQAIGMMELEYGDIVSCEMAGGGGYGDPQQRDPRLVQKDVRMGLVSIESALDDYGVVLDPQNLDIDWEVMEGLSRE